MKGNVYLIYDETNEKYKIGVTKNDVNKRLKKLQTGNSSVLCIKDIHPTEYMYRMETFLHNHYNSKRILNEWFDLSKEDVINFSNTCRHYENIIETLKDNPFFSKNLR